MKYAIELYYDKETEQKLFNLAKRVADEKLSTKFLEWKTRPHLTLACFNDVNEVKCIQQLKNFAQTHKPMPAYIGSIGMFNDTRTIFASPVMNDSMYQFQRELHKCLQDFDTTGWEWYCPNSCNGVQREHNKKLNNGLPILHKVPPKRDYGRYFCIMAEKGGTSHGGLTEKLSPFFHAKKQEVNAYGR